MGKILMIIRRTTIVLALTLAAIATTDKAAAQGIENSHYRKVLVIGAHPDDPETIAGGTMLVLKNQGCEVVSVYLTAGEAGIPGKSREEAAEIRRHESDEACRMMGIRHMFAGQIDGETEVTKERYAQLREIIERENPDAVFTHWPIDSHRDHRVCSVLVYDAWRQTGHKFDLYYAEAMSGLQSQCFMPTDYVDISTTAEAKHRACMCHASQGMDEILEKWHKVMERFRGLEYHCEAAEAFVRQLWNPEAAPGM